MTVVIVAHLCVTGAGAAPIARLAPLFLGLWCHRPDPGRSSEWIERFRVRDTPMLTTESLLVVLLLLPGFLAGRVFSLVAVQRRRSSLDALGEIVLFEFLIVCTYGLVSDRLGWWPSLEWPTHTGSSNPTVDTLRANGPALISLVALAVVLGVVVAWLHNLDQPLALLRRLGMTKQSTHASVWQGALFNHRSWIVVHLESGERIVGWPTRFSDTPEEGALFLANAAFVGEDDQLSEIQGPGLLLVREARIRMIEFLRDR